RGGVPREDDPRHSVRCLWLLPSKADPGRNFPLGGSPPRTPPPAGARGPPLRGPPFLHFFLAPPLGPGSAPLLVVNGHFRRLRPLSSGSRVTATLLIVRTTSSPSTTLANSEFSPSRYGAGFRLT